MHAPIFGTLTSAEENIIIFSIRRKRGRDLDFSIRICLCDFRGKSGRSLHQRNGSRRGFRKQFAEFIPGCMGTEHEKHVAAVRRFHAVLDRITCKNAGPRLKQGGDGGRHRIRDGKQVASLITIQNFLVDYAVLRHTAVQSVTVGESDAVYIDVRLNDIALPDFEFVLNLRADFYNAHDGFMPGNHRVLFQIFGNHARMRLSGANQLHIGKAKPDRFDLDQQFIVRNFRHGKDRRFIVSAEIFKSGAEQLPRQNFFRHNTFFLFHYFHLPFLRLHLMFHLFVSVSFDIISRHIMFQSISCGVKRNLSHINFLRKHHRNTGTFIQRPGGGKVGNLRRKVKVRRDISHTAIGIRIDITVKIVQIFRQEHDPALLCKLPARRILRLFENIGKTARYIQPAFCRLLRTARQQNSAGGVTQNNSHGKSGIEKKDESAPGTFQIVFPRRRPDRRSALRAETD